MKGSISGKILADSTDINDFFPFLNSQEQKAFSPLPHPKQFQIEPMFTLTLSLIMDLVSNKKRVKDLIISAIIKHQKWQIKVDFLYSTVYSHFTASQCSCHVVLTGCINFLYYHSNKNGTLQKAADKCRSSLLLSYFYSFCL